MYKTREGDTFETVSRIKYGYESRADLLRQANPGKVEPFKAGLSLAIPPDPSAPLNAPQQEGSTNPDQITIKIDGKIFPFWIRVEFSEPLDTFDTVTMVTDFDPSDPITRESLRPFSFKSFELLIGGDIIFSGTLLSVSPDVGPQGKTISVSAYALPGVLADCTAPIESYPLEFRSQKLSAIAKRLCDPFGLSVVINSEEEGSSFGKVAIESTEKVFPFLIKLAQQRGLVITNSPTGALVFQKSKPESNPVAVLSEDAIPVISVSPSFNPQRYYSHLTCTGSASSGQKGGKFTLPNSKLEAPFRPLSFKAPDTRGASLKLSAEAKMGRMFGDMVSYKVTLESWRDPNGDLWKSNTTVKLFAPSAMVYNETAFIVKTVSFSQTSKEKTAQLILVLPGSFSGKIPEALPWDE